MFQYCDYRYFFEKILVFPVVHQLDKIFIIKDLLDEIDFASFGVGLFPILRKRAQFRFGQSAHGASAVFAVTRYRHVIAAARVVVDGRSAEAPG